MSDNILVSRAVTAYQLGQRFAKKIRIGKRFYGSMRVGMKVYGLTYKDLDNPDHKNRLELDCFMLGYGSVLKGKQISVGIDNNRVTGFSDQWGNKV